MVVYTRNDYEVENFYYITNRSKHKKLQYDFCAIDKSKLRGLAHFQKINQADRYSLVSYCTLPLSDYEIFNLKIFVKENMDIEDYTIQYRNNQPPPIKVGEDPHLINGYEPQDISFMLIRSDFGHGSENIHTNIDYYTVDGIKISDPQKNFLSHDLEQIEKYDEGGLEQIVNIVLQQAEKVNHLIGIRYWLLTSVAKIVDENQIYKIWKESKITTPFCIFCNNLRNHLINEYYSKLLKLDSNDYIKISKNLVENILNQERNVPDSYLFLPISDDMFQMNFPFPVMYINGFQSNLLTGDNT